MKAELYQAMSYFDKAILPFFVCSECDSEWIPEEVKDLDACPYCGCVWELRCDRD